MLTEYRDKRGRLIDPSRKPIFIAEDNPKAPSCNRIASYVFCHALNGLKWIGHCENCQYFEGHEQYTGVRCKYPTEREIPKFYIKYQPYKKED